MLRAYHADGLLAHDMVERFLLHYFGFGSAHAYTRGTVTTPEASSPDRDVGSTDYNPNPYPNPYPNPDQAAEWLANPTKGAALDTEVRLHPTPNLHPNPNPKGSPARTRPPPTHTHPCPCPMGILLASYAETEAPGHLPRFTPVAHTVTLASQAGRLTLSRIFLWFASDFGGALGLGSG